MFHTPAHKQLDAAKQGAQIVNPLRSERSVHREAANESHTAWLRRQWQIEVDMLTCTCSFERYATLANARGDHA